MECVSVQAGCQLPSYATDGSIGADVFVSEAIFVQAHKLAFVATNISMTYPEGYAAFLMLRSSVPTKYGLIMPQGIGLIDRDYCGENDKLFILVYNITDTGVWVNKGDRIAQLVFVKADQLKFVVSIENSNKIPNRGGFGSTGQ